MTVDLNTCVSGQKCVSKDGNYLTYLRKINNNLWYPHLLLDEDSNEQTFTNDGIYDLKYPVSLDSKYDIICILPIELTTSDKHPSIAWWESCPWITDRTPTEADGRWVMAKLEDSSGVATIFGPSIRLGQPWIHRQDWQPPVLSNKDKALELLNKHEDSSTIGVWVPTPDDWDVIRKGLTE